MNDLDDACPCSQKQGKYGKHTDTHKPLKGMMMKDPCKQGFSLPSHSDPCKAKPCPPHPCPPRARAPCAPVPDTCAPTYGPCDDPCEDPYASVCPKPYQSICPPKGK